MIAHRHLGENFTGIFDQGVFLLYRGHETIAVKDIRNKCKVLKEFEQFVEDIEFLANGYCYGSA